MIKYTSKDIVQRAEQLADLQNSDFISDSEKSALLNEAWASLYQKLINANDRAFIKSVSAYDGLRLPKDFYQLSALYVAKDKEQVPKVNASQIRGYGITNNVLLLSHEYDDIEVTLEYFPVPKTIFYNSEKKESRAFFKNPLVLLGDDLFLAEDNTICSYSNDTEVSAFSDIGGLKMKNGVIVFEDDEKRFYNYGNRLVQKREIPFVIKGNEITYDTVKSADDLSGYLAAVMDEKEEILYFIGNDYALYDKDFNEIKEDDVSFDLSGCVMFCRGDGLYIASNGSPYIKRVLGDVTEDFPLNLYSFCCFVDSDAVIVSFNGSYYRMAYGFSTLLNYPNNIYYTILAYSLAVSFKIRQNGDPTLLNGELEKASTQFFDSLQRDANQFYTMKDVYRKSWGRIW